jgi:hypothetical protein
MSAFELVGLTKAGGPLTKRISLASDGSMRSDGSACVMSEGEARRLRFDNLEAFAKHISALEPYEAIALGALHPDLPDLVQITTKRSLNGANHRPDVIARTADYISYRHAQPAIALIDVDSKGMPGHVKSRISTTGGYWAALVSIVPGLKSAGRVVRRSTSAGIFRSDTGQNLPGSDGRHIYVSLTDRRDAQRFLRSLHDRCWLHGFGWLTVSRSGQLLERSLVDRMVDAPERLVFEGAPIMVPPLAQDESSREPRVTAGPPIDSHALCLDLSRVEQAKLQALKAAEAHRLSDDVDKARRQHIERFARRSGCTVEAARHVVGRQHNGILLPNMILLFDAHDLHHKSVGDVLADPTRFVGETLADPLEGEGYGPCKAKIMQRADGSLWIHSFAHGRTIYDLKYDAATIEAALRAGVPAEAANTFVRLLLAADLEPDEEQCLGALVCKLSGIKPRPLAAKIKTAREQHKRQRAQAERQRRATERTDPRPQIVAPLPDSPWLPEMQVLNEVLGASGEAEPPMRDIEGFLTIVCVRQASGMHILTAKGANQEETEETRLPPPEEPLLTRLDEHQAAELIERYIDYINNGGRSVHLAEPFVKHYLRRNDNVLPVVTAVATHPLVLPDGTILSGHRLDRQRCIMFRVSEQLDALLPRAEDCTTAAVVEAMRFLTDEWLVDVATDYPGKCTLITRSLTIIQRAILPERPAYVVPSGQRGGGKTTTINMTSMAVLGHRAAATAWSTSEEERRKSLFTYLGESVPELVWDNIARGTAISCPSIEKALTAESYKDRVLGKTESRTVPATTVHTFTGTNITARGDMASRSLVVRLVVDRPDPENRPFKHPDPVGWTEANRGRILSAFYTVLLGNPRLYDSNPPPAETRFKLWWHIVGSAVEHAAKQHADYAKALAVDQNPTCPPIAISFRRMFLGSEADEEQSSSLASVIEVFRTRWRQGCMARDVATYAGLAEEGAIEFKSALEQASGKAIKVVSATVITWRLKAVVDAPVQMADGVFVLRYQPDNLGGSFVVKKVS